jgi:predicted dehydrogenase
MTPLRAGIIGCGKIARKHAAAINTIDEIQLVSFYDHTYQNAVTMAQEQGAGEAYDDLTAMLDAQALDLAYICLPPFAHTNEVASLCKRKIHFLIEKPIALDLIRARQMVQAVETSGVKSQVGFIFRHGTAVQELRARIVAHLSPGFITARYACNSLHRPWWRDRERGGGQVMEQIIHLLDLARYFLGEPTSVFSMQDNLFHRDVPDYTVEDASGTVIRFENGSIAVIAATNGAIPGRWDSDWRVVLPDLTADFADANHAVLHHTQHTPVTTTKIESDENLFRLQTLDLVNAIRSDGATRAPIQEGYRSLSLALAAMDSAAHNIPMTITQ